jgi:hypothetical protein
MTHSSSDMTMHHYTGGGFTQWQLDTADTLATVDGANYLDGSASRLKEGDIILVRASTGGSTEVAWRKVSDVTDGEVTIAAFDA